MAVDSRRLPVGVVMPVLNARKELPRHLESMEEWLDMVAEVIVVDSHSEDGTMEYLKEHLKHPGVTFIDHPRGLYPSWNRGIAEVGSEYFFVSTLGDTTCSASIALMYDSAMKLGTDVLVGLPTLVDEHGRSKDKFWPLHSMVDDMGMSEASRVDPWIWLAWSLMYLPATPIGSSASNLYRTAYMKRHPFSAEYGHIGDSAWALGHTFEAKFGIEPRAESTFWVHEAESGIQQQYADVVDRFVSLAKEVIEGRRGGAHEAPQEVAEICAAFLQRADDFRRYFRAGAEYRELKSRGGLGARLKALRIRAERLRIRKGTLAFRAWGRKRLIAGSLLAENAADAG
jgi:hypothetical protein